MYIVTIKKRYDMTNIIIIIKKEITLLMSANKRAVSPNSFSPNVTRAQMIPALSNVSSVTREPSIHPDAIKIAKEPLLVFTTIKDIRVRVGNALKFAQDTKAVVWRRLASINAPRALPMLFLIKIY